MGTYTMPDKQTYPSHDLDVFRDYRIASHSAGDKMQKELLFQEAHKKMQTERGKGALETFHKATKSMFKGNTSAGEKALETLFKNSGYDASTPPKIQAELIKSENKLLELGHPLPGMSERMEHIEDLTNKVKVLSEQKKALDLKYGNLKEKFTSVNDMYENLVSNLTIKDGFTPDKIAEYSKSAAKKVDLGQVLGLGKGPKM